MRAAFTGGIYLVRLSKFGIYLKVLKSRALNAWDPDEGRVIIDAFF
jgi:hypothetical protein